jgi:hypothetical protein
MSTVHFAMALTLIALAVLAVLVAGVIWWERQPLDEHTEHGDDEP